MEPGNRFQLINSASRCSLAWLAGTTTLFLLGLAPIDSSTVLFLALARHRKRLSSFKASGQPLEPSRRRPLAPTIQSLRPPAALSWGGGGGYMYRTSEPFAKFIILIRSDRVVECLTANVKVATVLEAVAKFLVTDCGI
jgi:hypothetical protein